MPAPEGNQFALGNEGGRPTDYDPVYCAQVIEFCKNGSSLTAFAANVGVGRKTISNWMDAHEEFLLSVDVAKANCAAWWEARGREIAEKGGGPGASTLAMFGMKNMGGDDWSETTRTEHTSPDGSMTPAVAVYELPDNGRTKSD